MPATIYHNIFIFKGDGFRAPESALLAAARQAAARAGARLGMHELTREDLQDPRLAAALRGRGIAALPALATPTSTHVGVRAIRDACRPPPGPRPQRRDPTEDPVRSYFLREMAAPSFEEEDADDISADMKRKLDKMMADRKRKDVRGPTEPPAPLPAAAPRPDNISHSDEDELESRMANKFWDNHDLST